MLFGNEQKQITAEKLFGEVPHEFYDAEYYVGRTKSNWKKKSYEWENFDKIFRDWAAFLVTGFPEAHSFLDVGCARGFLEKAMAELAEDNERDDISIEGFDFSEWAIGNAVEQAKPFISCASVDNYEFTKDYDVLVSLDTFEHLTEEQATNFLNRSRHYVNNAGFFVIALDEERQMDEPSHVNLKNRSWWDAKFEECGWVNDWWAKMKTALAMREKFAVVNQVEIFVKRPRADEMFFATKFDDKLMEFANTQRYRNVS